MLLRAQVTTTSNHYRSCLNCSAYGMHYCSLIPVADHPVEPFGRNRKVTNLNQDLTALNVSSITNFLREERANSG
jgi:hypothetical protein